MMYLKRLFHGVDSIRIHLRIVMYLLAVASLHLIRKFNPGLSCLYFPELLTLTILIAELFFWLLFKFNKTSGILKTTERAFTHRIWVPAVAGVFFVLFVLVNHLMYRAFTFEWYDLGLLNQAIWNTAHGKILEITDPAVLHNRNWPNLSMLYGHVEWIFLLIAPVKRIVKNPELLLVLKITALSTSIIIISMISGHYISKSESFAVTVLFALFTPVHFIALKDFNADPLAIPFLLASYLCYIRKKLILFWLFLILALLCKEYVSFAVIAIGFLLLLRHRDRNYGLVCVGAGVIYILVCLNWINPAFNPDPQQNMVRLHYGNFGGNNGFWGMIMHFVNNPVQIIKKVFSNGNDLFYLLMPLLFLPVFNRSSLIAMAVILPKDLLVGMDISNHRLSLIIPFLFIGFIEQLKNSSTLLRRKILVFCLVSSIVAAHFYGPTPLGHRFWKELYKYIPDQRDSIKSVFCSKLPADVPVSVTPSFTPYAGNRRIIYQFPFLGGSSDSSSYSRFILYDSVDSAYSWNQWRLCNPDSLLKLATSSGFHIVEQKSGVYLMKRNSP